MLEWSSSNSCIFSLRHITAFLCLNTREHFSAKPEFIFKIQIASKKHKNTTTTKKMWHSVDHKKSTCLLVPSLKRQDTVLTYWTSAGSMYIRPLKLFTVLSRSPCDYTCMESILYYSILYIVYSILYTILYTHTHTHTEYNILYYTSWTVVCQVPLSMGFSRQEYWRISLTQGSNPGLPHCRFVTIWATSEAHKWWGSTIFAFPCGCFSSSSLVSSEILRQNLKM